MKHFLQRILAAALGFFGAIVSLWGRFALSDQKKEPTNFVMPAGYPEAIAHAANNWATLDYYIDDAMWKLAETPQAIGACFTSQLININARLNALLALMKLRGISEKLVGRVNKFAERVRGPNELRNRIVHDMWLTDNFNPEGMGKMQRTAAKKLEFTVQAVPLEALRADLKAIMEIRQEAMYLRDEILAELPTLPEIPHAKLHPIKETPLPR